MLFIGFAASHFVYVESCKLYPLTIGRFSDMMGQRGGSLTLCSVTINPSRSMACAVLIGVACYFVKYLKWNPST